MIDLPLAKQRFQEYVEQYDPSVSRIRLKIIHINRVAENSRKIAKLIGLSAGEQDLAELIGLLHDIGRFEQVRLYGTFSDRESVDHANNGVEILFQDGKIRNFIASDEYDQIIQKAISNHNKYRIEDGLSPQEEVFCKLIRDADKLDIFRDFLVEDLEDLVHLESDDVRAEKLSPEFCEKFRQETPLKFAECKTNMDFLVCILAFIYDFNFGETLGLVRDQDYVQRIIKRIDAKDQSTRERLAEIGKYADEFLNRHCPAERSEVTRMAKPRPRYTT